MKITINKKQGTTFVLVMLVMMVTSIWLASLSGLTSAGLRNESRRITLNETLASADASLELAWARWRSKTAHSSALPTETELTTGWTDNQKRYPSLNDGVTVEPSKVLLRQMDSLGRILKPDEVGNKTMRTDISRGLVKRSISYIATVTAEGQPIGSSSKTVKMKVNRVFQKSDIPLFQYLAFFDHTLFLHNGPAMTLGGRLHSNKRIYMQSSGTLTVKADMSGPAYNPAVYNSDGSKRAHSAIKANIDSMIAAGDVDDIRGFFYGSMLPDWTGNGTNDNAVVLDGARYNPSGELHLFDPNDTEYQKWWGDANGDGKEDWDGASNANVSSGFRELIEKPKTVDAAGNFANGQEDTLFISSKRFYNQANIKIEVNSSVSGFANTSTGVIDPNKVTIYYKDLNQVPGPLPSNASDATKLAAMKGHMAKVLVPADLKAEIMKALTYKADKFTDAWIVQENAKIGSPDGNSMDGKMDIIDIDMAKLTAALNAWMAGDIGHGTGAGNGSTSPASADGVIVYITDLASNPNTAAGKQKGVRINNGAKVPDGGVTMATDMLAYVKGDFNTGGTGTQVDTNGAPTSSDPGNRVNYNPADSYRPDDHPSAILADNIRLLSSAWSDTASTNTSSTNRKAAATTYNMAMVMGDRFTDAGETNTGGLHNFPRFLESWKNSSGSDIKATIYGAFIQLWQSKYIRYKYDNNNDLYTPPLRQWNFAKAYLQQGPPGSLDAVEYTRGQYWISLAP